MSFDCKTHIEHRDLIWTPGRLQHLWHTMIVQGVGAEPAPSPGDADGHALMEHQCSWYLCRLVDRKWTRTLTNSGDWVSNVVPITSNIATVSGGYNAGDIAIQYFDEYYGVDNTGSPSGITKGLYHMPFYVEELGMTYEQAQHGFLFVVQDMGAIGAVGRATTMTFVNVYETWEESRADHTAAAKFGGGVLLADNAIKSSKIDVGAIEADAFAADAISNAAVADGTIKNTTFAAGAINAAAINAGAIHTTAIADDAIRLGTIADGALAEVKFGDDAISARVLANDAIDAAAIAENAIDASELANLASSEIADYVWNRVASGYESDSSNADTMGERIAAMTRQALRWDDHAKTTQSEAKINCVANQNSTVGRFYSADAPNDVAVSLEWEGLKATIWHAADGRTTPCIVVAALNDGTGNAGNPYWQLRRMSDASTSITIATGDRLYFSAVPGLSASDILDAPLYPNHAVPGSLGDSITRIMGLRQSNMRIKYTAHNAAGTPTAGTIYLYASKADAEADTNVVGASAIGQYEFTGTFDPSDLKPLTYMSTKS